MSEYKAKVYYRAQVAQDYDAVRNHSTYRRYKWHREYQVLDKILEQLPSDLRLLDIPCGTGRFFPLIDEKSMKFMGADISQDMITQASSRASSCRNFEGFTQADAENLPFEDNKFDFILSMRFFHHLPADAVLKILREFRRVSKHGIIMEAPITQPISRILMALAGAKRMSWDAENELKCPLFPINKREFLRILRSLNLELAVCYSVTWFWGQNKICVLRKL